MNRLFNLSYKDLVVQFFRDVQEEGNLDIINELFHPEFFSDTYYGNLTDFGPGIEKLKKRLSDWRNSFSEKYLIMQIMENDEAVFCQYKVTIRQKNQWLDKKPKDKVAIIEAFILFKFKQSKIYYIKDVFDYDDLWSQLGYLVDLGEYQLPAHLKVGASGEKIKLKQNEVVKLETEFSTLQSSAIQYKDLLQYASYVKGFFDISDKAIRNIAISSVVEWQKEFKKHQSDLTGNLPQDLMMATIWIMERGKQIIKDLLFHEDDLEKLELVFNNMIDFFAKEYSK